MAAHGRYVLLYNIIGYIERRHIHQVCIDIHTVFWQLYIVVLVRVCILVLCDLRNVKLVPFFAFSIFGRTAAWTGPVLTLTAPLLHQVPLSAWLSALAAFLGQDNEPSPERTVGLLFQGTTLVALDDQAGVPPNVGDLLSLMAAAASAPCQWLYVG